MPALCGCSLRNLPGGTQGMRKGPTAWPDHMTHRYRPLVRGPVVNTDYCDRQGCDVTRERLAPAATGTLDRRPYWCDAPPRESPVGHLAEPPCRGVAGVP